MQKIQAELSWTKNNKKALIKNKFIIFIIMIIFWVTLFWIFNSFFYKDVNRDSFIVLIEWWAELNDIKLIKKKKEVLNVWDTVKTIWKEALAVLEWWDWSVTRLWWNTTVKIDNLYLSSDLDKINISFELLNWKTWSTVLSFLWKGSYFNETFHDSVAAVRWTVFDINLENNYLYVIDHKVNLTNTLTNETFTINEKKPFNIESFDFIALEVFLKWFKDKTWEALNYKIDKDLFAGLEKQIQNNLDDLIDLDDLNIDKAIWDNLSKEKLYNKILKDYQKLNFIKSDNNDLFKKKIEYKNALIKLSSKENKTILLQNTFYDFKDLIDSKNYWAIDEILPILWDNTDLIESLKLNKTIEFYKLPNNIKDKFLDVKLHFINTYSEIKNIDINNIMNNADSLIKDSLNWIDTNFINN